MPHFIISLSSYLETQQHKLQNPILPCVYVPCHLISGMLRAMGKAQTVLISTFNLLLMCMLV